MTIPTFDAGNVIEASITFVPESGTVLLADVTAKLRKADGTEVVLTGVTGAHPTFEVEWASAETDILGRYQIRWESSAPSPRIVVENSSTAFILLATAFTTP